MTSLHKTLPPPSLYPMGVVLGFCMVLAKDAKQAELYFKLNMIFAATLGAAMIASVGSLAYLMLTIIEVSTVVK